MDFNSFGIGYVIKQDENIVFTAKTYNKYINKILNFFLIFIAISSILSRTKLLSVDYIGFVDVILLIVILTIICIIIFTFKDKYIFDTANQVITKISYRCFVYRKKEIIGRFDDINFLGLSSTIKHTSKAMIISFQLVMALKDSPTKLIALIDNGGDPLCADLTKFNKVLISFAKIVNCNNYLIGRPNFTIKTQESAPGKIDYLQLPCD